MRKLKIGTRLFIAFFIVVAFTLVIGSLSVLGLDRLKTSSVNTMNSIIVLDDIYDYNVKINNSLYAALSIDDPELSSTVLGKTEEYMKEFLVLLEELVETRFDNFGDIFTPGEMQDMANLLDIYKGDYVPAVHEVVELIEQGLNDEAASVYTNRFGLIHDTFTYFIAYYFEVNLYDAEDEIIESYENSTLIETIILVVALIMVLVSTLLAATVTKSISAPLLELENVAWQMGNNQIKSDAGILGYSCAKGNDEISYMAKSLQKTLNQLARVQQIEIDAMITLHQKEKAEAQRAKAEAQNLAKSDFLAKMSHEIRTPMNAITGMAELALREELPGTAREHLMTIKQAGANLLSIINDILDLSKIESGKLEIVKSDYLFSSLVNDVISIIRMRAVDSQLLFVVNIDCNIPCELSGDEIRLRQVMLNILSNAVKYTDEGYVSLVITGEPGDDGMITLTMEVTDSGKGIKPEDLDKIFMDFSQVDLTKNKGIEGTGLGLSITRNLILAMGGDVSVSSEYGYGSAFSITLPQKIVDGGKIAAVENPDEKRVIVYELREIYADSIICTIDNLGVKCTLVSSDEELYEEMINGDYNFVFVAAPLFDSVSDICAKSDMNIVLLSGFGEHISHEHLKILSLPVYSISVANILNGVSGGFSYDESDSAIKFIAPSANVLVVDDINTNLMVASGLMLPYKMNVELCLSGKDALEAVQKKRFDVVFMDHMMPEMDGVETTARIRLLEGEYYKELPVVALTANAVSGAKEEFIKNGFSDFLSKPIDTVKLNAVLERWIPKKKREKYVADTDDAINPEFAESGGIKIAGVDVDIGIAMSGGVAENYKRTLAIFLKDASEKNAQITKCLEEENISLYVTYVHAMKSASGNVGAIKLSGLAKDLELAGKNGDMEFVKANNAGMLAELAAVSRGIDGFLKSERVQDGADGGELDLELLSSLLAKLAEAVDDFDLRGIKNISKDVQPYAGADGVGEQVEDILGHVLVGEYDEAVELINGFLKALS